MRYYHIYSDYHKLHCSETQTSVKCFHLILTIFVAVLISYYIASIIVIITFMIYRDIRLLLSPIPTEKKISPCAVLKRSKEIECRVKIEFFEDKEGVAI